MYKLTFKRLLYFVDSNTVEYDPRLQEKVVYVSIERIHPIVTVMEYCGWVITNIEEYEF